MISSATDNLTRVCEEFQNGMIEPAEWERALLQLCREALRQQDQLAELTTALRENAERARALEARIKNRTGARAA